MGLRFNEVPSYDKYIYQNKSSRYVVIIPVINEGEKIQKQLKNMATISRSFDVVIADGGSSDDSLNDNFLQDVNIRAKLVKTGPGKLSAQMRMGISFSLDQGYEGVIFMDGNNKDNPQSIFKFVEFLDNGYDHVQGSRFIPGGYHENTPLSRRLGILLLHAPLISMASGFRYTDTTNGFRAYSSKFLTEDRVQPLRNIFSQYELHYYLAIQAAKLGFKVIEIPVERKYPKGVKAPTKIKGFHGNLLVLKTLVKACLYKYNP